MLADHCRGKIESFRRGGKTTRLHDLPEYLDASQSIQAPSLSAVPFGWKIAPCRSPGRAPRRFPAAKHCIKSVRLAHSTRSPDHRTMFTTLFLAGLLLFAAIQTPILPVRIILLLLALVIGLGGGAAADRGT